jgi:hypothetical protein
MSHAKRIVEQARRLGFPARLGSVEDDNGCPLVAVWVRFDLEARR